MTTKSLAILTPLLLALVACGPTLTRGPSGWHDARIPYTIAPLDSGDLFPAGWRLMGYSPIDGGFHRDDSFAADLELRRQEDDGALVVTSYLLREEDGAKRPEVLADRWLDAVVEHPKRESPAVEIFASVIPQRELTANGSVGLRSSSSTMIVGRNVESAQRESFSVPGGEAVEVTATLSPTGSPPDRQLYVAVIKQTSGARYAVVAYGNTPTMFDKGLAEARSFAHRIRF